MTIERKKMPVTLCTCNVCGHEWRTFGEKLPVICAKCHSRQWNGVKPVGRPRKQVTK